MTCSIDSLICFLLWLAGMPSWATKVKMASRADWLQNGILCLKLCNFAKSGMAAWESFLGKVWDRYTGKLLRVMFWICSGEKLLAHKMLWELPFANLAMLSLARSATNCLGPGTASCSKLSGSCFKKTNGLPQNRNESPKRQWHSKWQLLKPTMRKKLKNSLLKLSTWLQLLQSNPKPA